MERILATTAGFFQPRGTAFSLKAHNRWLKFAVASRQKVLVYHVLNLGE